MNIVYINSLLGFIAGIMLLILFCAAVIINGIEIIFEPWIGKVILIFLIGGIVSIFLGFQKLKQYQKGKI